MERGGDILKRNLSLILILSLSTGIIISYAAQDTGLAQSDALGKFMEIAESWSASKSASESSAQYPDYYGGSYINDNNELVIYLTDDTTEIPALLSDEDVIIDYVSYSYNELYTMVEDLTDKIWENPVADLPFAVYCIGVSDSKNRVFVDMDNPSQENIQIFKDLISDSPMIIFQQGAPISWG